MNRTFAAAALAVGLAGPASAAVITQTLTTGIYDPRVDVGTIRSITYQAFDTSLGMLTGVDITIAKSLRLAGTSGNFSTVTSPPSTGGTYGFQDGTELYINGQPVQPPPGAPSNFGAASIGNGAPITVPSAGILPFDTTTRGTSPTYDLLPGPFTRPGTIGFTDLVQSRVSPPLPSTGVIFTAFQTEDVVTLNYTYTPNAVPEPLSLGLLGAGALAAVASRLRR